MVGAVAGLVLLGLAGFFYSRNRRQQPQNAPRRPPTAASGFEPTDDVQVIVPFASPPRPSADNVRRSEAFNLLDNEVTADNVTSSEKDQAESSQGQRRASSDPASLDTFASGAVQHRADDMDGNVLPPKYNGAWGQRYSANLEDAAAVTRWEKAGMRASDGVSP